MSVFSKSAVIAATILLPLAYGVPAKAEPITMGTLAASAAVGQAVFGGHPNTAPNKVARGFCNIVSNPFKKKKNSC